MDREVCGDLDGAIRLALGTKQPQPHKRQQANSESNAQKKENKLPDGLHEYALQIAAALRCRGNILRIDLKTTWT
jgi:hypothetical protein